MGNSKLTLFIFTYPPLCSFTPSASCDFPKQMLKAFTPVAVLIFSFFSGLEKTSAMELYIVGIICVGVALTSAGETYFSWTGFTFQSLGILAESSRLVPERKVMKEVGTVGKLLFHQKDSVSYNICSGRNIRFSEFFSKLSIIHPRDCYYQTLESPKP